MGYYMGDYYSGDPGLFSFLGGALKGIGGIAKGILGIGGGGPSASKIASQVATKIAPLTGLASKAKGVIVKHPVLSAAGAAGAIGAAGGRMVSRTGTPAAAGMAAGGRMVGVGRRHRRMRVTNPKALRRAIRRAEGFKRLALRVLRFSGHRPRGRAYFKPRRRRK